MVDDLRVRHVDVVGHRNGRYLNVVVDDRGLTVEAAEVVQDPVESLPKGLERLLEAVSPEDLKSLHYLDLEGPR